MDTHLPEYAWPQQLNRYSYALNNPNAYTDPDGQAASEQTRAERVAQRKQAQLEALGKIAGGTTSKSPDTGPAERFLERKLARLEGRDTVSTTTAGTTTPSSSSFTTNPIEPVTGALEYVLEGFVSAIFGLLAIRQWWVGTASGSALPSPIPGVGCFVMSNPPAGPPCSSSPTL